MKRVHFRFGVLLAMLATVVTTSCFVAKPIYATDATWTGATSTTWSDGSNWGGTAPTAFTDNAVFTGTFTNPNQPDLGTTAANLGGVWMTGTLGQNVTISGTGTGVLTLNGNTINSVTGLGILVDNTDASTLTIAAPVTLNNPQTWRNNSTNALTISGKIGGSSGTAITLDGSGVVIFSAQNTFPSLLTVKSGTLSIDAFNQNNADGELGHTSNAVTLGGSGTTGTILYTGPTSTGRSKKFTLATDGTGVFNVPSGVTLGITGLINGSGGLTKEGPGTLSLTGATAIGGFIQGALAYTGLTTINNGILDLTSGVSGFAFTGGIAGAGKVRSAVGGNQSLTEVGPINNFTGTFELQAGASGNQFGLEGTTPESLDGSHATFIITGANADTANSVTSRAPRLGNQDGETVKLGFLMSPTIGSTNSAGNVNTGGVIGTDNGDTGPNQGINCNVTWEIGALGGTAVYSGDIVSAANYTHPSIIKVGAGSQTFAGANSNYLGTTTISSGSLIVGTNANSSRLATKSITSVDTGSDTLTTGSNHGLQNGDLVVLSAKTGNLVGATLNTVSYFVVNATANTFQISTSSGGSAVDLMADGTTALNVEYGVAVDTVNNKISIANNGFQNGDKVVLGASGGTFPTNLTANKPYFVVNRTADDFQVSLTAGGSPILLPSAGTAAVFVTRPGALGAGNSPVALGDANTGSNDVNFAVGGGDYRVERPINVTSNGSGVTSIGGLTDNNSTFSGAVTVNKDLTVAQFATTGTNALHVTGGISSGGGSQTITFGKTGFLGPVNVESIGITDGSGTVTVNVAGNKTTIAANSTYSGGTTVSSGTLAVNASVGGNVSVSSGGTLQGTGSVGGTASVAGGGTIAPGNSIGTLTTGGATINGTLRIEYDGGASTIDKLAVSGALNITSATVDFDGVGTLSGSPYVFASYGSLTGSAFSSVLDKPTGYNIDYNYLGNKQIALVAAGLLGDWNHDNHVNAADYVTWRKDPTNNGNDPGGYASWRTNFDVASSAGPSLSGLAAGSVPEPSTIALVAIGFVAWSGRRGTWRSR